MAKNIFSGINPNASSFIDRYNLDPNWFNTLHPDVQQMIAQLPTLDEVTELRIVSRLQKGIDQISDQTYYSVQRAPGGGNEITFFGPAQGATLGQVTNTGNQFITNVSNGDLDKDKLFFLTHIQLILGSDTATNLNAASLTVPVDSIPAIANGEYDFVVNDILTMKNYSTKDFSVSGLAVNNNSPVSGRIGEICLKNPKFLPTQKKMEFKIRSLNTIPLDTVIGVFLRGLGIRIS